MNFNNNYDLIGVAMVEELFKEAAELLPISDKPTPNNPSLLKRLVQAVRGQDVNVLQARSQRPCGEESATPKLV